jgi:hypothetical protein
MSSYESWSLIINTLIAIGLISVVLIALFGSRIKRIIFPAKLNIEILDKNGELTILDNGHRVIYYHLRVINKKAVIVKNCRLFIKKIQKLLNDGSFVDIPVSVPPRYIWSPSESSPEGVDIVTERVTDFGYVIDSSTEFKPTVTPILNSFKGNLKHHETFRYCIEIIAENYRPRKLTLIEVTWDGLWPEDVNEMHKHLSITKVKTRK